jgi:hypothetical protein
MTQTETIFFCHVILKIRLSPEISSDEVARPLPHSELHAAVGPSDAEDLELYKNAPAALALRVTAAFAERLRDIYRLDEVCCQKLFSKGLAVLRQD